MRVVAGTARGRPLVAPPGNAVRPTSDRVREAVCNSLGSLDAIDGAVVLDLFAGSGALGVEALSRGAASATFVDSSPAALGAVRTNVERAGVAGRSQLVRGDALAHVARLAAARTGAGGRGTPPILPGGLPAGRPGDHPGGEPGRPGWEDGPVPSVAPEAPTLVFCDPPYDFDRWEELLAALSDAAPGAVVVAESDRTVPAPEGAEVLRDRRHGGTVVTTIRLAAVPAGRAGPGTDHRTGADPARPLPSEDPT